MTYADQLKSPKWQKKRLEIMERDNFTCTSCGDTESQFHVHHGYYEKGLMLWEYNNDTLHTLCFGCHSEAHSVLNVLKEQIGELELVSLYDLMYLLDLIKEQDNPRRFVLRQMINEFENIYSEQICKYPF